MDRELSDEALIEQLKQLNREDNTNEVNEIVKELIRRYKTVVETHINYIVGNRYDLNYQDIKDIRAVASEAIQSAAERYSPGCFHNTRFSTYVRYRIDSAIRDWIRGKRLIAIPNSIQMLSSKYLDIVDKYKSHHKGEMPTDSHIREALGVSEKTYHCIEAALKVCKIDSLDAETEHSNENQNNNSSDADCLTSIISRENCDTIFQSIAKLKNPKERIVILGIIDNMTLEEIADILHVSKSRIHSLRHQAAEHLINMQCFRTLLDEMGYQYKLPT